MVLLGVLLAGVTAGGATGRLTQGDPLAEQRAINAADQQVAKSLVIQPTDLPGWRPFGRYPKGGSSAACPKFKPDFSDFTITGEKLGRQFARRNSKIDEALTSAATVYETPEAALGEWRIWTSSAAVACLRDQIEGSAPAGAISITAKAVPLRLPRVAPRQFARRYKLVWFTVGGDIGTVYFDDIYLVRGRADVSLLVQRLGPPDEPPTATVERQLVRLLGQRLAHAFP